MKFLPAQFSWIWRMSKWKFHLLKYFPSHRILKSCSQKFTDHLNVIWHRVQVTEATNGFIFQMINSLNGILTWFDCIPPSQTCELFWAIFAFATLFSSWNKVHQPNYFSLLSVQNEVNELLLVKSLKIKVPQLQLAHTHTHKKFFFRKCHLNMDVFKNKETLFAPKFDSRLVNSDWLIIWQVKQTLHYVN